MYDLALIGAGGIGKVAAYILKSRGFNILILDKNRSALEELSRDGFDTIKIDLSNLSSLNDYLKMLIL